MTPVDQSIMHDPENGKIGDCFRACVASLLDLPLEKVPHFMENKNKRWFDDFTKWLSILDMSAVFIDSETIRDHIKEVVVVLGDQAIVIAGGKSPKGVAHSVLWTFHEGGRMVHDPHPSRKGILEVRDFTFITKGTVDAKKEERNTQNDGK